jgi:hypothetical protein
MSLDLGELRRADEIAIRENRSINETIREVREYDRELIERNNEREENNPRPSSKDRLSIEIKRAQRISKLNNNAPVQIIENFSSGEIEGRPVILKHSEIYLKLEASWVKVDETFSSQKIQNFKIDNAGKKEKKESIARTFPPHHPIFEKNEREFKSVEDMKNTIKRKNNKYERIISSHEFPSIKSILKNLEAKFIDFNPTNPKEELVSTLGAKLVGQTYNKISNVNFNEKQILEISTNLWNVLQGNPKKGLGTDLVEFFLGEEISKEERIKLGTDIIYYKLQNDVKSSYIFLKNLEYSFRGKGIVNLTKEDFLKIEQNLIGGNYFKGHKFKGPKDNLRKENEKLFQKILNQEANTPQRMRVKSLGIQSVVTADEFHFEGKIKEAKFSQDIAKSCLDILLSLTPGVSIGKDIYESLIGKNLITGDSLSNWERSFAVLGIVSLGMTNYISRPLRVISKILKKGVLFKAGFHFNFAYNRAKKILISAKKIFKEKADHALKMIKKTGWEDQGKIGNFLTDVASPKRKNHILYGDVTGGGHLWPGKPGKTSFPKAWKEDKIMSEVSNIVIDPKVQWKQITGRPGLTHTRKGIPVKYEGVGVRDSVKIKVIIQPEGEGVITAFPLGARNEL